MNARASGSSTGIAIIGMACRFPGANSPRDFWRNLCDGVESTRFFDRDELLLAGVTEAELNDPHYVRAAPVIDHHAAFDAAFFDYSPREAALIDPQQRHFLEVSWETFESAGFDPLDVHGTVGVYAGAGGLVSSQIVRNPHPELRGQTGDLGHIGNDRDFLCSRVSFKLNLRGPSVNVQTACSTSLVAVHLACQSLLSGETDMALAGASVVRIPHHAGYLAQPGNIYSPDGHCRAFDARASGTLFGSGVAALLLKPLDRALADGNHIHAVIRGSAVSNDGSGKLNFTASAAKAQARAMVEAITLANIDPHDIGFVECHGTATALGDPVEIQALSRAFKATGAKLTGYCPIGSVKSNFGHLEQCAGLAGLIKAALCVEHGQVPPTLHYQTPNPRIPFANSPFYVGERLQEINAADVVRTAVNSVGMGGTNAFTVLERAPTTRPQCFVPKTRNKPQSGAVSKSRPFMLPVSAPDGPGLARQLTNHRLALGKLRAESKSDTSRSLVEYCASASRGGHQHLTRAVAIAASLTRLEDELHRLASTSTSAPARAQRPALGQTHVPRTVFIFSGQGPQHPGMGRILYDSEQVFRARLDEALDGFTARGIDLRPVLFGEDPIASTRTLYAQSGLFALQEALVAQWSHWGWTPNAVVGHSIGEFAAARVAGALDFEQALDLVTERARLMDALPARGQMVAVAASRHEVESHWPSGNVQMALASDNSPASVVISGAPTPVNKLCRRLRAAGITLRPLTVSHAFHSPLMRGAAAGFAQFASERKAEAPATAWYSTVSGQRQHAAPDGDYWGRQIASPVLFRAAIAAAAADCDTFLEVGADGSFSRLARQTLEQTGSEGGAFVTLASLNGPHSEPATPYMALGEYWKSGGEIAWSKLEPCNEKRSRWLPTYAFERRAWQLPFGAPHTTIDNAADNTVPPASPEAGRDREHPMLPALPLGGAPVPGHPVSYEILLDLDAFEFLREHRVQGRVVLPTTVLLEVGHVIARRHGQETAPAVRELFYERAIELPHEEPCWLRVSLRGDQLLFESTYSASDGDWIRNASATVGPAEAPRNSAAGDLFAIKAAADQVDVTAHYLDLAEDGLGYGASFQGLCRVWSRGDEVLAEVDNPIGLHGGYLMHPAFLDACLHTYSLLVPSSRDLQGANGLRTWVPLSIERYAGWRCSTSPRAWVRATRRRSADSTRPVIDITVLDQAGGLTATIEGLAVAPLQGSELFPDAAHGQLGYYLAQWEPLAELESPVWVESSWVIAGGNTELRQELSRHLEQFGASASEGLRTALENGDRDTPLGIALLTSSSTPNAPVDFGGLLDQLKIIAHLSADRSTPARVWLITHGAQSGGHGKSGDAERAAVWGLGRSFALEYPQHWGGLIDLPPEPDYGTGEPQAKVDVLLESLARELVGDCGEEQLCLTAGGRQGLRLVAERPSEHATTVRATQSVHEDAIYWITGGTGSLGLAAAEELTKMGARHLLLTSRRGAAGLDEDGLARLAALRTEAEVLIEASDVTLRSDIQAVLKGIDDRRLELGGLLHSAAVFDAAVLANLNMPDLKRVLDVKFNGARLLHELTRDRPLGFFILYSSVLSLWGGAGQAAYAAANAALDALALQRRFEGLPATVINWGPWKNSRGTLLGGHTGAAMWRARATRALDDGNYLPVLRRALHSKAEPQLIACTTDWQRFADQFTRLPPLFEKLCRRAPDGPSGHTDAGLTGDLSGIARVASDLLGFEAPVEVDRPLTELGLDSLLAVNLANRLRDVLDLTVPTAALLKGATVADLAEMTQPAAETLAAEPMPPSPTSATLTTGDGWLIRPAPRPEAHLRLLCFPFAGGGAGTFRSWADKLAPEIELVAIEPPGRQTRLDEAPLRRLEDFVAQLVPHLLTLADKPMAVYGHCLGALTMYETVCALVQAHEVSPVHAFVSGARTPDQIKRPQSFEFDLLERLVKIPEYSVFEPLYAQHETVFTQVIQQFRILATSEMLASEELRNLLLPLIRAEFEMSSHYRYENRPRWQFPLTCIHGRRDTYATEANARAWGRFTEARFELVLSDGEHFLVVEEEQFVVDTIGQALLNPAEDSP